MITGESKLRSRGRFWRRKASVPSNASSSSPAGLQLESLENRVLLAVLGWAEADGPYIIDEGADLDLDASGSAAFSSIFPLTEAPITSYMWDLDDSGTYETDAGTDELYPALWADIQSLPSNGSVLEVGLEITDGTGWFAYDSAYLLINNVAPDADAGGPYTGLDGIDEGEPLQLDASASFDLGGDLLTYLWDLDNDGVYDDAAGETPSVPWSTLEALGLDSDGSTLTIGLRVDDGEGGVSTTTTDLEIGNLDPTASAGGGYEIDEGQDLLLDGTASSDLDGNDNLTYEWDIAGNSFFGASRLVTWAELEGIVPTLDSDGNAFTISLVVSDDDLGESLIATTGLTIYNVDPTADAGGPYPILEGDSVTLAGFGSDPNANDTPLTYDWDLDNDNFATIEASGANPPPILWGTLAGFGLASDGTSLTVGLRVTDGDGAVGTDTALLLVISNDAPDADAGGPYTGVDSIDEGQPLQLDGSLSSDLGGDPLTYLWDLDSDGVYDDAAGVSPEVPWSTLEALGLPSDGITTIEIGLRVDDGEPGGVGFASADLIIK